MIIADRQYGSLNQKLSDLVNMFKLHSVVKGLSFLKF